MVVGAYFWTGDCSSASILTHARALIVTELDMKLRPLFMLTCSVADLGGGGVRPRLRLSDVNPTQYSRSFLLQDRSWTQEVRVPHHQGPFHCGHGITQERV